MLTDRQSDASNFIICPTLWYSNGTDNEKQTAYIMSHANIRRCVALLPDERVRRINVGWAPDLEMDWLQRPIVSRYSEHDAVWKYRVGE